MSKPISRPLHGLTDYNYINLVSSAPKLVGFEDDEKASAACRIFSGAIATSTFFTRAEWGFVRVMPHKAHVGLDFLTGLAALGAPWVVGFSQNKRARNTFLVMGITGVLVGLLSQTDEME